MEASTLTVGSRCLVGAAAAHGARWRDTVSAIAPSARATLPRQARRLRALPPELSEILAPKLVPGSPADTGDVSSLIPISAVMLLFYLVSNWVFPAVVMRGMQPNAEDEAAASEAESMAMAASSSTQGSNGKVKKKRKKRRKEAATEA